MDTSVGDLLTEAGFRAGLVIGGIVAVACALRGGGGRDRRLQVGGAFAAAVVAGFLQQSILDSGLLVGILALAAAAFLATGGSPAGRVVATVPGAVLIAISTGWGVASWETVTVLVLVVVGGPLLVDFDRTFASTGGLPLLVAVTAAGVWATIPETQHAVVLAGVSVPMIVLGWPGWRASLGSPGATLLVGLIGWTVVADGAFRASAVVGGVACLGVLLLEPIVRRRGPRLQGWRVPALVLVHIAVVALSSRAAGVRSTAAAALLIVAAVYAVAAAMIAALAVQQARAERAAPRR